LIPGVDYTYTLPVGSITIDITPLTATAASSALMVTIIG